MVETKNEQKSPDKESERNKNNDRIMTGYNKKANKLRMGKQLKEKYENYKNLKQQKGNIVSVLVLPISLSSSN